MADTEINYDDAIDYWTSTPATIDGVLGGFGHTSLPKTDVKGSLSFYNRVRSKYPEFDQSSNINKRALDVGAGIGRVTKDLLSKICDKIDLLEPVIPFAHQIPVELERANLSNKLGQIYKIPMQDFTPNEGAYWIIWCQWCLGQLKDDHLVTFLIRCKSALQKDGLVFVKENNTSTLNDDFDEVDSSVTRSDASFRDIFIRAGYEILHVELQRGLPSGLLPVRTYALRPIDR
ncbi:alpha-N-methyltransferase NTM1 [Lipomyces arxii]|uniref:alpha-N-methyltransferase NTM1 n=1 Tax=Lipomyces arxii TaxID=56418 RepID=UPI0034CEE9ED